MDCVWVCVGMHVHVWMRVRAFLFACFFPPSSSHSNFLDEGQPLPPSVVVSISYSNQNFGLKFLFQTRLTVLYAVKKKNWGPYIDITLWPLSPPYYNHRGVVAGFSCSNRNFRLKFRFQTRLTIVYAEKKKNWGPNIDITLWPLSPPHYNQRGVVAGFSCSSRNFGLQFRFQTRLTVLYAEE